MRQREITEAQDIAIKILMISKFIKLEVRDFKYLEDGYYFVVDTELDAWKAAYNFAYTDIVKIKKPKIIPGWRVFVFNLNN